MLSCSAVRDTVYACMTRRAVEAVGCRRAAAKPGGGHARASREHLRRAAPAAASFVPARPASLCLEHMHAGPAFLSMMPGDGKHVHVRRNATALGVLGPFLLHAESAHACRVGL